MDGVFIAMTVCGDKIAPLASAAIRSIHRSTQRHQYDATLFLLHDGVEATRRIISLWSEARAASLTRLAVTDVLVNSSVPGAKLFRLCATVRLGLQRLLPQVELAIYMDADVIVQGDLREMVGLASTFNATQWMALATEDGRWYTHARHIELANSTQHGPFFGDSGLNTGIFLANLTRWRRSAFDAFGQTFLEKGYSAPLGDQDIVNAYYFEHPAEVFLLPCKWNQRTDSTCSQQRHFAADGIYHGSRQLFTRANSTVSFPAPQVDHGSHRAAPWANALGPRYHTAPPPHNTPRDDRTARTDLDEPDDLHQKHIFQLLARVEGYPLDGE